jgi:hypothetical protein
MDEAFKSGRETRLPYTLVTVIDEKNYEDFVCEHERTIIIEILGGELCDFHKLLGP